MRCFQFGIFRTFPLAVGVILFFANSAASALTENKFEIKEWDDLSNHAVSPYGEKALQIDPKKWRHAETENYIIHFRRETEAKKVFRELELNLAYVAEVLGAENYQKKAHAYVFEDDGEWKGFLVASDLPVWASSLAVGDELFLNVRSGGKGGRFDYHTLAHEATHAVVARLYPESRWPLWFNEGFAETMAEEGIADRRNQSVRRHQQRLQLADLKPEDIEGAVAYPEGELDRARFYQSAAHFVRFIRATYPKEKFPTFVSEIVAGRGMIEAALSAFPDHVKSEEEFRKELQRFSR